MDLIDKLIQLDKTKRAKLEMTGLQGQMNCDCGAKVDFYWSWYAGFEWVVCQNDCKLNLFML